MGLNDLFVYPMRSPNCLNTADVVISSMSILFLQVCSGSSSMKQIYEESATNGLVYLADSL